MLYLNVSGYDCLVYSVLQYLSYRGFSFFNIPVLSRYDLDQINFFMRSLKPLIRAQCVKMYNRTHQFQLYFLFYKIFAGTNFSKKLNKSYRITIKQVFFLNPAFLSSSYSSIDHLILDIHDLIFIDVPTKIRFDPSNLLLTFTIYLSS